MIQVPPNKNFVRLIAPNPPGQPGAKELVDLSSTQPPPRNWVPIDPKTQALLGGFRI